ncbi:MAG: Ig-like domain-containing protein, partial [Deltaproteobacteria bacterium]
MLPSRFFINRLSLFIGLAFLLTTCAPLPKEGESDGKSLVTLSLQHQGDRTARSNTSSRQTEFIVGAPGDTVFTDAGPTNSRTSGLLDLATSQITLELDLDTPIRLFAYRYAENLSLTELQRRLNNQSLAEGAIDFGKTSEFTIPADSTEESISLTVLLQREAAFLDAAVQGITVETADGIQTTDADGLFVYFPEETVQLSLGDFSLGSFTNPAVLTPYSVFGVTEGESANNVLNLVRLLMTLDGDGNPDNGIQLNDAGVSQLGTLNLNDFDTAPENFDSNLPQLNLVESGVANLHLKQLLQQKNNPPSVVGFLPSDNGSLAPLNTSVFVEFSEPLRQSSISGSSAITLESAEGLVGGTVSGQGTQLSFKPSNPLTANTSYTVTLDPALTDQDGKAISGTTQWTFLTGDQAAAPALIVKSTSPDNGSEEVALNATLAVYFADFVISNSEDQLWILVGDDNEIACNSRISENAVYCQPDQNLSPNTNYTLTLQPNLISESGSLLEEPFLFSFTTGSELLSTGTYLQHLGRLVDNYTNEQTVSLLVSSGTSQSLRYFLSDQAQAPTSENSGWQTSLSYPIEVPFTLSDQNPGTKTIYAWFDDGEQIVDETSLDLIYDPVSPIGSLNFAEPSTQNTEVGLTLSASDEHSLIGGYLIREDNLTPTPDTEGWVVLESPLQNLEVEKPYLIDPSQEGSISVFGWVIDLAGNLSPTLSDQLVVDFSPPSLSAEFTMPDFISDFSWGLFTLNLGLEDNAAGEIFYLFSLDSLEPENDDQRWQVYTGDNLTFSLADSNEGTQTLYLWLRDSAGNRAEVIPLESYVDRTPPTFDKELQINSGALSSGSPEVFLSWDVSDNGSGLDSFYLSETEVLPTEENQWLSISADTQSYPYTFSDSSEGLKALYLIVKDKAQNISWSHAEIRLDFSSPQLQVSSLPDYLNGGPHAISLSGDELIGEVFYLFGSDQAPNYDSVEWISTVDGQITLSLADYAEGPVSLNLWIKDEAGNIALAPIVLQTTVEKTPPELN